MNPNEVAFSPVIFQLHQVTLSHTLLDGLNYFFRDRDRLTACSQDPIDPSCPFHLIVVNLNIQARKKIIGEKKRYFLNHLAMTIPVRFRKGKEGFNPLMSNVHPHTMLISWFGLNDIPLTVYRVY